MTRAALRRLHSPDLADLEHGLPADPECFGLLVQAFIGPDDGPGEEPFDFLVCTPRWLAGRVPQGGFVFGRHHLLVQRYDFAVLQRAIQHVCNLADGATWVEVAAKLAHFGRWEFEDYHPGPG